MDTKISKRFSAEVNVTQMRVINSQKETLLNKEQLHFFKYINSSEQFFYKKYHQKFCHLKSYDGKRTKKFF